VAIVEVQCPECGAREVVKYGRQANGQQRYRLTIWTVSGRSFFCTIMTKGDCPRSNGKW
jgi:InsA N-terminal domain